MGGYFTYEEMLTHLDQMAAYYPNLITAKAPLPNYTTTEGRPIYWLKISGNPNQENSDKPQILYTALHHAREPLSMSQLIFYMYYLLENYKRNSDIKNLIDHTELYFVPCMNPDGYIYNQTTMPTGGGMWRKNRRDNSNGTLGVDLNRNYGHLWGYDDSGSSPNPNAATYRGSAPFSEPETQALRDFCLTHHFSVALNYHTYGNLLIYPWSHLPSSPTPDHDWFTHTANQLTWHNRFKYGTSNETVGYLTNGDANDWLYGEQTLKNKVFAFTPEIGYNSSGNGFWLSASNIIPYSQRCVLQNLQAAYIAGCYYTLDDLSPVEVMTPDNNNLRLQLQRIGITPGSSCNIYIEPITANITSPADTVLLAAAQNVLDTLQVNIPYSLNAELLASGQTISFRVIVDNGSYPISYTITKIYQPNILLQETFEASTPIFAGNWGISNTSSYTGSHSAAHSPDAPYENFTINEMVSPRIDLTQNYTHATLSFWAKWNIQPQYDYAQVLISTDSLNYSPLCGKYNKPSALYQPSGQMVYDDNQLLWIKEEIDLSSYIGNVVWIKFKFASDGGVTNTGMLIDDVTISAHRRNSVALQLKARLEGAYNPYSSNMRTYLRQLELLPPKQPFDRAPWFYFGDEQVEYANLLPSNTTDWVLVELRDADNPTQVVARKAAILRSDGTITDLNHPTSVIFENTTPNTEYYVAVRPRNHIATVSAQPTLLPNTLPLDFREPSQVLEGSSQLKKLLATNFYAFYAGDYNGDGVITVADYNSYVVHSSSINQYLPSDGNLDGQTTVSDFNIYLPNSSFIGNYLIRY